MESAMRQRLILTGLLLFFFGFPVAGLVYFWNDAHRKIQISGDAFVRRVLPEVATEWDYKSFLDKGSVPLVKNVTEAEFGAMRDEWGRLQEVRSVTEGRSWATERDDMMSQFVRFHALAKFERGEADITILVTRKTVGPRWRIEDLSIAPAR